MTAVFAVVDPEKSDKAVKQLRSLIFPEEKYDELKYLKMARDTFKRMQKINLNVKPL